MTSLWPGGPCEFCEPDPDRPDEPVRHDKCIGWARRGYDFCGCCQGLCRDRLTHAIEHDDQGEP